MQVINAHHQHLHQNAWRLGHIDKPIALQCPSTKDCFWTPSSPSTSEHTGLHLQRTCRRQELRVMPYGAISPGGVHRWETWCLHEDSSSVLVRTDTAVFIRIPPTELSPSIHQKLKWIRCGFVFFHSFLERGWSAVLNVRLPVTLPQPLFPAKN